MKRILLALAFLPAALAASNYKNFQVSVYIRAQDVRQMKDPEWLRARWSVIEKALKVDKVYIETHRDMIVADEQAITQARRFFEGKGIRVAGGITTTVNERNRFQTFCYTNPEQREHLKKVVEYTARMFDEIILDDFFFTSCKCESCIRVKGSRTWTQFRLALMEEVARDLVIGPARSVNSRVKLTIKYPNWYDHYQFLGYNLEAEPKLFDKVHTGTETRDAVYNNQHLQPYLGYALFRFLENIKPGANAGGWVDPFNRRTLDRYAEELLITLFAKAPEVTLFDFHSLLDGNPAPATLVGRVASYTFEQADSVLGRLGKPIGVKSYKPFHSSGEDFLHTYLGTLGIPIDLGPEFPIDAPTVLLTESAKFDPAIVDKIKKQLMDGKNVVITSGLLRALQGKGIRDVVELEYTGHKASATEFWRRTDVHHSAAPILIPEIRYPTNDAWELVSCLAQDNGYPILLEASYAKGVLYVLTIPDNFADLYNLPPEVLTAIKEVIMRDLPVRVESAGRTALFVYDNDAFVVESFHPNVTTVKIVTDKRIAKLRDLVSGQELDGRPRGGNMVFETFLLPHSYRAFAEASVTGALSASFRTRNSPPPSE
jgi:hypothetical protein